MVGFEFLVDLPTAQKFRRESDGAEVLVPKEESLDADWAELRLRGIPSGGRYPSPCCAVESRLRRIVGSLMLFRCMKCEKMWERELGQRPHLSVVR